MRFLNHPLILNFSQNQFDCCEIWWLYSNCFLFIHEGNTHNSIAFECLEDLEGCLLVPGEIIQAWIIKVHITSCIIPLYSLIQSNNSADIGLEADSTNERVDDGWLAHLRISVVSAFNTRRKTNFCKKRLKVCSEWTWPPKIFHFYLFYTPISGKYRI